MGGGNQIDIVAPSTLQTKHHLSQFLIAYIAAPTLMGNGPILAKDAAQIAVGEKYCAGTVPSHQRLFFAKMSLETVNPGFLWSTTKP